MKSTAGDATDLSAYLDRKVYPALYERLDSALPEFGWWKRPSSWVATKWPEGFPVEADHKKADRLQVYFNAPHCVRVHGRESVRLLNLIAKTTGPLRGDVFINAVREACGLAGVPFPEREWTAEEREKYRRQERRGDVLEVAVEVLHRNLDAPTLAYLEKRGLTKDHASSLSLGLYRSASALRGELRDKGFTDEEIDASEVVFPFLEGYVVFPWRDERGRLITLYGRSLPGVREGAPKMMGLPGEGTKRSPLFMDSVLQVRSERELVLVEGLFDAAVLRTQGDGRVACLAGARLSKDQAEAVARQRFRNVYVCGDPDAGGDAGCIANANTLRSLGVQAYIAPRLPDGLDPDEFVLKHGIDAWLRHINGSMRAAKYLATNAVRFITPSSTDSEKETAINRCLAIAEKSTGPFARLDVEEVVEVAAQATGYSPEALAKVEEAISAQRRRERLEVERRSAITSAARSLDDGKDTEAVAVQLTETLRGLESREVRIERYSTDAMIRSLAETPEGLTGDLGEALDAEVEFRSGELALVAARPGHGKTSVLIHLLHHWTRYGHRVAFVSFEEKREDIFCRMVARMCADENPDTAWTTGMVRRHLIDKRGEVEIEADFLELEEAIKRHREIEHLIEVVYAPQLTAGEIEGALESVWDGGGGSGGTSAVLVDYLNRIPVHRDASGERRDRQISLAAQALKVASVRLKVPFISGVQINRDSIPSGYAAALEELANDNATRQALEAKVRTSRPQLHHLREGGSEQEADLVLALLNHAADFPSGSERTERLDIGVLKNRYGVLLWDELAFYGGQSLVCPLTDDHALARGPR